MTKLVLEIGHLCLSKHFLPLFFIKIAFGGKPSILTKKALETFFVENFMPINNYKLNFTRNVPLMRYLCLNTYFLPIFS